MKRYVILLCTYFMYPLQAMKNNDIVFTMPFSHDSTKIKESEDSNFYTCHTLEDVKTFVHNHNPSTKITSPEYLKKYLDVSPSVFAEKYVQEHNFNDTSVKDTAQNSALTVMTEMKSNNSDEYLNHVLAIVMSYASFNEGFMTLRRKNITPPMTDEDPVAPLIITRPLNQLVVEDLAKNNSTLKETISAKEFCDKIYQFSIALLTAITIVVPLVQEYLGHAASPVVQPFANCSSIFN